MAPWCLLTRFEATARSSTHPVSALSDGLSGLTETPFVLLAGSPWLTRPVCRARLRLARRPPPIAHCPCPIAQRNRVNVYVWHLGFVTAWIFWWTFTIIWSALFSYVDPYVQMQSVDQA